MKNIIKTDVSRALINWQFPFAIVLMFLVWELNSRRFQNVEDILFLFIHVWGRSVTSLMAMVVSALGYTGSCCEDTENHFLRYVILRIGPARYTASKILVCFSSAFLILLGGTALFILKQSFQLPIALENGTAIQNFQSMTCFGKLLASCPLAYMGIQTLLYGLLCGSMSVLALAFSTFIKNSYGVFVIPFLLHFLFSYLLGNLISKYTALNIFNIFKIYDATASYTENPVFFLTCAMSVTALFVLAGYGIMYKKLKGEFQ